MEKNERDRTKEAFKFDEMMRAQIRTIQQALHDVDSSSVEMWEADFRADENPQSEIALWLYIADLYGHLSDGKSSEQRKEIFSLLLRCSLIPPGYPVPRVAETHHLSLSEGEAIVAAFFENAPKGVLKGLTVRIVPE